MRGSSTARTPLAYLVEFGLLLLDAFLLIVAIASLGMATDGIDYDEKIVKAHADVEALYCADV